MRKDEFGDRMKAYENADTLRYTGEKPVYMRLDGRSFSRFTRVLVRDGHVVKPRDIGFENCFVDAVRDLVDEFNFSLAFHQSDEISLFFKPVSEFSQLRFNGNTSKLLSVVPSYFTASFVRHFWRKYGYVPEVSFDARICEFPDTVEATNMLVWRWQDAKRNLIQDIAHHRFGHKKLDKMTTREKFEMIGSPELRAGNFIKREPYYLEDHYDVPVLRHRISRLDIDFDNMSFEDRMKLVFADLEPEDV